MVAADIVVLRVAGDGLEALLVKRGREPFKGRWVFPGGFMEIGERLAHAASRELHEETGLKDVMLEPFGVFDAPDRDPRGRVISAGYIGLVCDKEEVAGGDDAAEARWFPASAMPDLAFDHEIVLETALEWLSARLGVDTEEPACFLTMTSEEQSALRRWLAETMRPRRTAS